VLGSNSDEDKDQWRIRLGLIHASRLPTGDKIRLTSESHILASNERIEEVMERRNENGRASSVMGRNRFG
jgi:hypothetical protein